MTTYVDLKSLDPSHPLRNRPLGEIGAEYEVSGVWRRYVGDRSFNNLAEWIQWYAWRATLEKKT